ncbi:hypothetical protein [Sphingomonas pokkalii]|uniref:PEP-CTERM protein-sorting domain-containing protein n=1 Tax=Sphingomonas pokkalii TaxID=2175090 RepID=A0A2U0SEV6_9SPHN|nr:hypothetical protein [Sphingomonas pokkalii]PVX29912.1 hypothetical protein DD559_11695 [Sphingomonas pokkalii]
MRFRIRSFARAACLTCTPAAQAQVYTRSFRGTVTTAEIFDIPINDPDIVHDFKGQAMSGLFRIDLGNGFTDARYSATLSAAERGQWLLLIGGMGLGGAALRLRGRRAPGRPAAIC